MKGESLQLLNYIYMWEKVCKDHRSKWATPKKNHTRNSRAHTLRYDLPIYLLQYSQHSVCVRTIIPTRSMLVLLRMLRTYVTLSSVRGQRLIHRSYRRCSCIYLYVHLLTVNTTNNRITLSRFQNLFMPYGQISRLPFWYSLCIYI